MAEQVAEIDTWTASDGYRAAFRRYLPAAAPRANLVCLHGIQSHGGWYERSSSALCQAGYAVYFLDRRGSGRNEQARGDAANSQQLLDDVREFMDAQNLRADAKPVVLLGCSWGGKLAAAYVQRHPDSVEALALLYPGIAARVAPRPAEQLRIFLARLLRPSQRFPIPLNDPRLFTGSPDWQQFIAADRLCLRTATARLLTASVFLDLRLRRLRFKLKLPTLLLLAGRDRIIDNRGVQERRRALCRGHQTTIIYPEAEHTLEFEPRPEVFIGDLLRWLEFIDAEIHWKRRVRLRALANADGHDTKTV